MRGVYQNIVYWLKMSSPHLAIPIFTAHLTACGHFLLCVNVNDHIFRGRVCSEGWTAFEQSNSCVMTSEKTLVDNTVLSSAWWIMTSLSKLESMIVPVFCTQIK